MKILKLSCISLFILVSCSKKQQNNAKESSKNVEDAVIESVSETRSVNNHSTGNTTATLKTSFSSNMLQNTISDFISCKNASTTRKACRNTITKFISEQYGLNEFKDKFGEYEIYDSIQPIIQRTNAWVSLGKATNQHTFDKAIEQVNNGKLGLVIDTSESYGHIAIIQPGTETKKSGSWNLKLPMVVSLFNSRPSKSFSNKSLAYAFKKSNDLEIFIRK